MASTPIKDTKIEKIDRFLDKGIVQYFYRAFYGDFGLQRDIRLASFVSNKKKILNNKNNLLANLKESEEHTDSTASYNILVKKLTNYTHNLDALEGKETWLNIKNDILNYFNPKMKIYTDLGQSKNRQILQNTSGYLLNENNKTLSFYDGKSKTQRVVCNFTRLDAQWKQVLNLLPSVFKESTVQNSMQLNSNEFIQLIDLARQADPSAQLHLDVEQGFITVFNKLNEFEEYSEQLRKHKINDSRNAEQFIEDVIGRMQDKIDAYLASPNISTNTQEIMKEIKEYLETGDSSNLTNAVAKNDRNFLLKWLFPNQIDRTIKLAKIVGESEFFQSALNSINSKKSSSVGDDSEDYVEYKFGSYYSSELGEQNEQINNPINFDPDLTTDELIRTYEQEVDRFWLEQTVTKKSFLDTLDKMESKINDIDEYIDVELPKIPFQDISQYQGEDDVSEKNKENTVVEHIKLFINQLKSNAKTSLASANFQTQSAALQKTVTKLLNASTYESGVSRRLADEKVLSVYLDIGYDLIEILNETNRNPQQKIEVKRSVVSVRKEINRLLDFYTNTEEKLRDFQKDLKAIRQSSFANAIEEYLKPNGEIDKKREELNAQLEKLNRCRDDEFDVTNPKNENEKAVVAVVDELQKAGEDHTFTDILVTILTSNVDRPDEINENLTARQYKKINDNVDAKYNKTFNSIMDKVNEFTQDLVEQEESKLSYFFRPDDHKFSSQTSIYGLSIFDKHIDNKIDSDISINEKIINKRNEF